MHVNLVADTTAYIDGMRKAEQAMKRERRRELIANTLGVIGAVIVVGYILWSAFVMVSDAAW
jgi:hypothetical protein